MIKVKLMLKKKLVGIGFMVFVALFGVGYYFTERPAGTTGVVIPNKIFNVADIRPFDGSNDNKPIYIGLNGLVYDVSAGREFYNLKGPYHYLAGRDSSIELNQIGGGIIKRKYPVVGKLIK